MNYRDKSKEELITELELLKSEYTSLKERYQKDIIDYRFKESRADAHLFYGTERQADNERRKKEGEYPAQVHNLSAGMLADDPGSPYILSYSTDLAKQRHAEEALRISEERFRNIFEQLVIGISITSIDGKLKTNNGFCNIVGYSEEELSNLHWQKITHPDDVEYNQRLITTIINSKESSARWEKRYLHKKGHIVWVDICTSLLRDEAANPLYFITTIIDITDRKLAEIKLKKLTRLYSVISQVNQTIVHIKDKDQLLAEICRITVDSGCFRMAWIGLINEEKQTIMPKAFAGFEEGYLSVISNISVADQPEGNGPTGKAIREGKHIVCSDFENDPNLNPWRDEALKRDYRSSIALPIKRSEKVIGAFSLYASVPHFFDQEEIELLTRIANDISFALDNLELDHKHKKTLASLIKSENRFRNIFNNLQDAYFQADKTGKLILVSPSAVSMYGYGSLAEMTDLYATGLYFNPETRVNLLKELTANGRVVDFIALGIRKDSSSFWVSMNVQIQYDENGQFTGTIGVVRDISERMQAEEKIIQIKKRFETMFEQAPLGITLSNSLNDEILEVNAKFAQIIGRTKEETKALGWMKLTHPDDLQMDIENMAKMNRGEITGYEMRKRFIRSDGSPVWVNMTIASINPEHKGNPQNLCMIEDITDRISNEGQIKTLSTALEQSPSMIAITDKKGKIEYINTQFTAFTQYSAAEVFGKNPRIFNPEHHTSESFRKMWQTLESGQVWKSEFRNRKKDGTQFWENVSISPLITSNGLTSNYIIIQEDITEKKHLISELIRAKEKAEESDRLKSAFLANMSHKIRTPMNGILGFAGLLEEPDLTGDEHKEYISIIEKSGARLLNILNEIIDISRIESGQIEVVINKVNINEQVKEVFDILKLDADAKGLKFFYNNSLTDQTALMNTDQEKLYAVLINLVKNAIKYTDKGTIEFGYVVGPDLIFYVKDTGIGIPSDRQKAVFERFIQADIMDLQARQGAGLGLSIAKAYVEMLGGKIWVESEYGKGSVFYFSLPSDLKPDIKKVDKSMIGNEEDMMINPVDTDLKILIVEDDETSKKYLTTVISKISRNILLAFSGDQALEICRKTPDIDLVLMDIRMPGMNGYDATQKIRQFNKEVIIIAQTAFGLIRDREKSLEAGCNDHLSKPIKKDELLALINSYFPIQATSGGINPIR